MKRIFHSYAYSDEPRARCWWDETCEVPVRQTVREDSRTDVLIVGAGFTGISAALHLARAGVQVTVLDAKQVGWGASGRNGGFCCLGGGMQSDASLDRLHGLKGRVDFRRTELAAINLVEELVNTYDIDVDRHSKGETVVAHRAKDMIGLREDAASVAQNYDVACELLSKTDLETGGMAGPFYGGLTIDAGFALNPRKYISGLAAAAEQEGALILENSAVDSLKQNKTGWTARVNGHSLQVEHVIMATNGYSSEDVPEWLSGRYLPGQSNVIVTRPLTDQELNNAGWTSDQMVYDTRNLLHYFRLMPDRRFLFGMRGGLFTGAKFETYASAKIRADFDKMFPAWRHVEAAHSWSGMVCIARDMMPFVGEVPNHDNLWMGMCYHGNGVAMGSYSGALLAQLVQGKVPDIRFPEAMKKPLRKFELGRFRRAVMPFAYAGLMIADR